MGCLLSIAVIAPWHIVMYEKYGKSFLDQYLRVALMTGIKGYPSTYSKMASLNPWYAYFEILLANYWPWLPFLAAGFVKIIRDFKKSDKAEKNKSLFVLSWAFVR